LWRRARVRPCSTCAGAGRIDARELQQKIEGLTGRKVVGFMSDNHIDPDVAIECSSWRRSNRTPQSKRRSRCPSRQAGERVLGER
jgi:hypothetical protein